MESYQILEQAGDGSFGTVFKASRRATGELVAIKRMKKKFSSWSECVQLREVKSLQKLGRQHPNIVALHEVFRERDELYFVFEYVPQNMYQVIQSRPRHRPLPVLHVQALAAQMVRGLWHLHRNGLFHRDLKPENLLLTAGGIVKIADFGLCREIRSRPPFTEYVSTRWYRAPEILLRSTRYSSPIDIWAVGAIIAELFSLRSLFPGTSELDQLFRIASVLGTPANDLSYFDGRLPARCVSGGFRAGSAGNFTLNEPVYAGGGWPEGHKLAAAMGYRFPHAAATPLQKLVTNAPPEALRLIADMLAWNPQFRPTAQELALEPWIAAGPSAMPMSAGSRETASSSPIPVDAIDCAVSNNAPAAFPTQIASSPVTSSSTPSPVSTPISGLDDPVQPLRMVDHTPRKPPVFSPQRAKGLVMSLFRRNHSSSPTVERQEPPPVKTTPLDQFQVPQPVLQIPPLSFARVDSASSDAAPRWMSSLSASAPAAPRGATVDHILQELDNLDDELEV